jgi:paraquat-inducible protein B
VIFSSSRLFTRTREFILYFSDSLNGLNEGAPVKYRGVTIGSVKKVMIHYNQATNDYAMPVVIEIQENLLRERLQEESDVFTDTGIDQRIRLGLRGSLQAESLVTGVLYVEIHPTGNEIPPVYHQVVKIYRELPTEATGIQVLLENLSKVDIKGIEVKLTALVARLDTTIESLKMKDINQGLTNLLISANHLIRSPDLTNAIASLHTTLEEYRMVGEKLNTRLYPMTDGITNTLAQADVTLAELRAAAGNLRSLLAPDSPLGNGLDITLQQLSDAAQSISSLAEFLKQNPNALIVGREIIPKKR